MILLGTCAVMLAASPCSPGAESPTNLGADSRPLHVIAAQPERDQPVAPEPIGPTLCVQPGANCQPPNQMDAKSSTRLVFRRVAENVRVAAQSNITNLCWRGAYTTAPCESITDDFWITYYTTTAASLPGTIVAGPFKQSAGTLSVTRIATGQMILSANEYEYVASHAPVALAAETCYWVEITNGGAPNCSWFWETATGGDAHGIVDGNFNYTTGDIAPFDFALCISAPFSANGSCTLAAPANDVCSGAIPLTCGAIASVDNRSAANDASDPTFSCNAGGAVSGSVWYSFVASTASAQLESCGSAASDTILAVFGGACGALTPLACSDNVSGCGTAGAQLCVNGLSIGATYYVMIATRDAAGRGPIELRLACSCGTSDPCTGQLRGDANGDGVVNNFDIDAFVLALVNPNQYEVLYGPLTLCRNDVNHDNAVNNFDIDPFVACIVTTPLPGHPCP